MNLTQLVVIVVSLFILLIAVKLKNKKHVVLDEVNEDLCMFGLDSNLYIGFHEFISQNAITEENINWIVHNYTSDMLKHDINFMSHAYPGIVVKHMPEYMCQNRPLYMAMKYPQIMFEYNPDILVNLNIDWALLYKRDWVEKNRPEIITGSYTNENISNYIKMFSNKAVKQQILANS